MKNVDLRYHRLIFGDFSIAICHCKDAEFFSENLLKQLLISNDGSEVLCAMAISRCEDGLKIRVEYLN